MTFQLQLSGDFRTIRASIFLISQCIIFYRSLVFYYCVYSKIFIFDLTVAKLARMHLTIPFSEIPEHGVEFEIKDSAWLPEELATNAVQVSAHVRLTRKKDNKVELSGNLKAEIHLACDRCLEDFVCLDDTPMQLILEVAEKNEHWRLHDLELAAAELETITLDKPVVELGEILRQQLLLSLPAKKLCRVDCRGLCPQCGADLNKTICSCEKQAESSPFAVLGRLKKK